MTGDCHAGIRGSPGANFPGPPDQVLGHLALGVNRRPGQCARQQLAHPDPRTTSNNDLTSYETSAVEASITFARYTILSEPAKCLARRLSTTFSAEPIAACMSRYL